MPRQPTKPLSIAELARLHGVSKKQMRKWLYALHREKGGVLFRFSEKGKWFSSVELLRRALPEMQAPDAPSASDVAAMQAQIAELKAICMVLRNRYRDLRKKVEGGTPKT